MRTLFYCMIATLITFSSHATDDLTNELALVENWLAAQRAYDRVPGLSAAVVHDQEIIWSGASGMADVAGNTPASVNTIYGICSISKLFTGIAVMQLRDQGKLGLDDPMDTLLPWFDLAQSYEDSPVITLRSVLSHSSGLPRESDSPYWMGPDYPFPTREQLRQKLGEQSTLYPAQRYYQYSNLGLSLVGEIVAAKSGQEYDTYIEEHILEPLGMRDTATGFPTDRREPRIAMGYGYAGRSGEAPELPRYNTRGITPAAGFSSTVLDLAKFAAWQFRLLGGQSNKVLNANTLREMQRVQWIDQDWSSARGLAFGVYRIGKRTLTGHGGDCPGFNTRLYIDPVSQYAVITMANRNNTYVDSYATTILDILEAGGSSLNTSKEKPSAIPDLADYVGSYDLRPWGGERMVFRWNDGLAVVTLPGMNPIKYMVRLQHIKGDRFHTIRSDKTAGHEVVFKRDQSGRVTHIVYHSTELPKI